MATLDDLKRSISKKETIIDQVSDVIRKADEVIKKCTLTKEVWLPETFKVANKGFQIGASRTLGIIIKLDETENLLSPFFLDIEYRFVVYHRIDQIIDAVNAQMQQEIDQINLLLKLTK